MSFVAPGTKSKVFVSYHHGGDRRYYDSFSSTFCDAYDVVFDNSPERRIDSEDARYVIQRIRDKFITGSSCTIVLVGQHTWGRKYVDWEIDATLEREHGLIGAYLPTAGRSTEGKIIVPDRLHANIESGYAVWVSWEQLTASTLALTGLIAQAKAKSRSLIDNTASRLQKNAAIWT